MDLNILVLLGACAIGLSLGLMGSGGSILSVPVLVYLADQPEKVAIATSLVIIALKSFSGFVKYLDVLEQTGLAIDWQVVVVMIIVGGLGSTLGNKIADKVPHAKLKKMFGVFLTIMGIYILANSVPQFL